MRIFVYEFVTGGGLLGNPAPAPALVAEGAAMVRALAADFAALPGARVAVMRDERFAAVAPAGCEVHEVRDTPCGDASRVDTDERAGDDAELATFDSLAASADWTVVIAPELDGALLDRSRRVLAAGGRFLSPGLQAVALASDKQAMAEALRAAGVPTPQGRALSAGEPLPQDFPYPAVVKPRFGAGSLGVRLVPSPADTGTAAGSCWERPSWRCGPGGTAGLSSSAGGHRELRIERYCPGLPASIAWLCGPGVRVPLPACRQRLSDDGTFRYLGGSVPLPDRLCDRARRLTAPAIELLGDAVGYVGIDVVLGENPSGRDDYVIEINPRLTTSYVGLRALCRDNLAGGMLAAAAGRRPAPAFGTGPIDFQAAGATAARGDADSASPASYEVLR